MINVVIIVTAGLFAISGSKSAFICCKYKEISLRNFRNFKVFYFLSNLKHLSDFNEIIAK